MDKQKLYLVALGMTLSASMLMITILNGGSLEFYVIVYAMIYTALTVVFRPRKRWIDIPGIALFVAFCGIITIKFLELVILTV